MGKKILILLFSVMFFSIASLSHAFFIDFEDGTDGTRVNDIAGVSFDNFNGYEPLYGDSRTGAYNTTSDDLGMSWGGAWFHHNGYQWLWASADSTAQGTRVDFDNNDGTWFTTGYSANSMFYLDAYFTDGTMTSVSGANNLDNPMAYLTVNAPGGIFIDYIVLHDSGNQWLVDDMSGDATGVGAAAVPEPATMFLLGTGLVGVAGAARRKKKNQA